MDKNLKTPQISVLMPVYNGEKYLTEAIPSILSQTFKDFEFLIIDDGSTDKSAEIILSLKDPRIKYIANEKNMGLPYSLNRGLDLAKGKYIARMDADDIALPKRLQKQAGFMDTHPDIAVLGTWTRTFGGDRAESVHKYFAKDDDIRASLLFNTSLAHPTVMLRKSTLDAYQLQYDASYRYFEEDYDLWVRMSKKNQLANLPEVLLKYRLHNKSVTHINTETRKAGVSAIRQKQLETLGLSPNEEDMRIHNSICPTSGENIETFLQKEERWLKKIIEANKNIYAEDSLRKIIYARWYLICMTNRKRGFTVWKKFTQSELSCGSIWFQTFDSVKIFIRVAFLL